MKSAAVVALLVAIIVGQSTAQQPPHLAGGFDPAVRELIAALASPDALKRGQAANDLGHISIRTERNEYEFGLSKSFFGTTELTSAQRRLIPAVAPLILLLRDEATLGWHTPAALFESDRHRPTTPGLLAKGALLAIGRPAIEPLIGALDASDALMRERAAEVLIALTEIAGLGGDRARWAEWWRDNQDRKLPAEAGDVSFLLTLLAVLGVPTILFCVIVFVVQSRRASADSRAS